jgi:hypothetical protein
MAARQLLDLFHLVGGALAPGRNLFAVLLGHLHRVVDQHRGRDSFDPPGRLDRAMQAFADGISCRIRFRAGMFRRGGGGGRRRS